MGLKIIDFDGHSVQTAWRTHELPKAVFSDESLGGMLSDWTKALHGLCLSRTRRQSPAV